MTGMNARKVLRNQRGIALLIALTVITVLVGLSLALNQKMNTAFDASVAGRHQTELTQMASSGIQLAMAMLVKDKLESQIDSVQEDWAVPDKVAEAMAEIVFDQGALSVTISDERSRIQVNALVSLPGSEFNPSQFHLWDRLLGFMVEQYEPLQDLDYMILINSLKDWIDSGDDDAITGLSGAESSYYEDLDPPYECRNAPLDHLGDLARVKGFPPELFSGADGIAQISDYMTVYGMTPSENGSYSFDGKININTASAIVLAAILPDDYETFAQEIVDYRSETADETYVNDLTSVTWYKSVPGLEELELDAALITTVSDLFRITSRATLADAVQITEAVVQRETDEKTGKWRCKILYWQNK
jgi:general secretion pathway protein K